MKKLKTSGIPGLMYYMKEREKIRRLKEGGAPWPWSGDPIFQKFKFTNVKRAHDRTTKAFVRHYKKHYQPTRTGEVLLLYNCGIARYFGTEAFVQNYGWALDHEPKRLVKVAGDMFRRGEQVFTGAYMITNAQRSGPKEKVVAYFLGGLWKAAPRIVEAMRWACSWEAGYAEMSTLPGFKGTGFMCKEVLQDFLLVSQLEFADAATWTPMGPGARRGMNRLLGRPPKFKQPEAKFIVEVQDLHKQLAPWWFETYPPKRGEERLTAHDVQFCLCEYDKYERTRLGQGRPRALYRVAK
jgi:hypothetical protein